MSKIFALEGEWSNNYKTEITVLPGLQLLQQTVGIPFIHRTAATHAELFYHLKRSATYSSYDILYLAFHGEKGALWFPSEGEVTLKYLAEHYGEAFKDKYILISSCSVAKNEADIQAFKKATGAKAVAAYRKNVLFFESMLLDLACLQSINELTLASAWRNRMEKEQGWLVEKTGLVIV
jgi:hypothetical protein